MSGPTTFALAALIDRFLVAATIKYAATTLITYREPLSDLLSFCVMRDLVDVRQVSRQNLEQYQRHLMQRRRQSGPDAGKPLSIGTQRRRITVVRSFFRFLVRHVAIEKLVEVYERAHPCTQRPSMWNETTSTEAT